MSLKLKALSLGLLAAVALSAVLVANAGATRSGHFTVEHNPTTIVGTETFPDHKLEFSSKSFEDAGLAKPIVCKVAEYHGTVNALTTEQVEVKPTWKECETTPLDTKQLVTVHTEGCELKLTSRSEPGDATAGLTCPPGKKITITSHNGCRLSFGPQTIANAATYDTLTEGGKHAITLTATAKGISFTVHNGPCIFLPTTINDGTLEGAATVKGINPPTGLQNNITAT